MNRFELLIAYDVVEFITRLPKSDRIRLRDRFREIAGAPG